MSGRSTRIGYLSYVRRPSTERTLLANRHRSTVKCSVFDTKTPYQPIADTKSTRYLRSEQNIIRISGYSWQLTPVDPRVSSPPLIDMQAT